MSFDDLNKKSANFRYLLMTFADEYPHAMASGKAEVFKKALVSVVDLFSDIKIEKKS